MITEKESQSNENPTPDTLFDAAINLVNGGISVVICKANKQPIARWSEFQTRRPGHDEISQLCTHKDAAAIATIGGQVSGGLEILDFDAKTRCVFDDWQVAVRAERPELYEKLSINSTPSVGFHVRYRYTSDAYDGNQKLATDSDGKTPIIETRGEGGYALCPPSPGYRLIQKGDLSTPISKAERDYIVNIARTFDATPASTSTDASQPKAVRTELSPGDDYNQRGSHQALLSKHGWQFSHEDAAKEFWTRPGKSTKAGHSAAWAKQDIVGTKGTLTAGHFKVFTSDASPLDEGGVYDLFGLYARLEHNGDFNAAAKALTAQGYGEPSQRRPRAVTTASSENELNGNATPNDKGGMDNRIRYTDGWNAKRLIYNGGDGLRYCAEWGKWLIWDGRRFNVDKNLEIAEFAKRAVMNLYTEAYSIPDKAERQKLIKYATKCDTAAKYRAMVDLARSEPGIPVLSEDLDVRHTLLNVENGTVDLMTGTLIPHDRKHLLTKLAPVRYDAGAKCPFWLESLELFMNGSQDLIHFLQKAVGYSLTGIIAEKVLFLMHGSGDNGKSSFIEAIRTMLGDYGQNSEPDLLVKKRHESHPTGIANLFGARWVSTTEIGEGVRLDEALTKRLTGGDSLSARFMRQDFFDFEPTHKLWIAVNELPRISETKAAIWNRIRCIPFSVTIPKDKQLPFNEAQDHFRGERSGILNWAIEGCLAWQEEGLGMPMEIERSTEAYRQDMDIVGRFIDDSCVLDHTVHSRAKVLYENYKSWCETNGEYTQSQKLFGTKLREKGLVNRKGTYGYKIWDGIGIIADEQSKHGADTEESNYPVEL